MNRPAVLGLTLLLVPACAAMRVPDRGGVVRGILASMVQLRAERPDGGRRAASGVVVAGDPGTGQAWVVTTRHFLDPEAPQQLHARRPGQRTTVRATVVARSQELDLAVLEVQGLEVVPAALKEESVLGDEVLVVAFPWGRRLTVVSGIVSQIAPQQDGVVPVEGSPRLVDASVSYGSSGGGVFDAATGTLIAIIEGYRTARVSPPEAPQRTLDLPVAGETTVIAAADVLRFLRCAGLQATTAP